jgi:hypothetical protein
LKVDELAAQRRFAGEAAAVMFIVIVLQLLFRWSGTFLFGAYDDDGVYVVLGKAIAQGAGYRSIHLVGAPEQVRFPPGLPLLLAIPWAMGGSLQAVRVAVAIVQPIVIGCAGGLIWWVGRRHLNLNPFSLAICAVSPLLLEPAIQLYNLPLSEPYFIVGWVGALALTYRLFQSPKTPLEGVVYGIGIGLLLAATTLIRSAGIALIPSVLVALILHRRGAAAASCAVGTLVPLSAWWAIHHALIAHGSVSSLPDDLPYSKWLGLGGAPMALASYGLHAFLPHSLAYAAMLASFLWPSKTVGTIIVVAAAFLAAVGCVRLRRTHTPLVLTVVFSTAFVVLWPYGQDRLLLPLLPFFGLLVASTVERGARSVKPSLSRLVYLPLGAMGLIASLRQVQLRESAVLAFLGKPTPWVYSFSPTLSLARRSRFIHEVADWVTGHTRSDDRIMVDAAAGVYLYSGRQTVGADPTESHLGPSVFAVPGRYLARRILSDSLTVVVSTPEAAPLSRDIAIVMARCPGVLNRHPASPRFPVYYRVHRDDPCLNRVASSETP